MKMKNNLEESVSRGKDGNKRTGSYVEIDDSKSARSVINEDKMRKRINEQFPNCDAFDNESGKSIDINEFQANLVQLKRKNQVVDEEKLRRQTTHKKSIDNPHILHTGKTIHLPSDSPRAQGLAKLKTNSSFDHSNQTSKVYPKLLLMMIALILIEVFRKFIFNQPSTLVLLPVS